MGCNSPSAVRVQSRKFSRTRNLPLAQRTTDSRRGGHSSLLHPRTAPQRGSESGNYFKMKLLSYDGLVAGWLYCHFSVEGEDCVFPENEKYFSMQKINLAFLEEIEEQIKIEIKQNCDQIYSKSFKLNQRSKTLFPNIKRSVRLSDVFKIEVSLPNNKLKPIMFLVDHIKRGKNTTFEAWLRNAHKNRVGNMFLEYYMENLFLQNERRLRTRKAIHPDSLEYAKTIAAKKINQKEIENEKLGVEEKEKDRKQFVIKKKIEEADKRILKINNSVNMMLMEIRVNQGIIPVMPCLRKSRATYNFGKEDIKSITSISN